MAETAIAGLGMTELGKVYGPSPRRFAAKAVRAAAADAGLALTDLDGLIVSAGLSGSPGVELARTLGLRDLRLLVQMNFFGATAGAMAREGLPLRARFVHPDEGESHPVFEEHD